MESLKNHFLIAMPGLSDPFFFQSVTYLCEHNQEGAIGIVINQPLPLCLEEVFKQMNIKTDSLLIAKQVVFAGGPVHKERGYILHRTGAHFQNTIEISNDISLTTSQDILQAIAEHKAPNQNLVALGYAHWEPNQLEKEMGENSWVFVKASNDILFHVPVEQRWKSAMSLAGIDINKLSDDIGHA